MDRRIYLAILVVFNVKLSATQTYQERVDLQRHLFANYSKHVRPIEQQRQSVVITVCFFLNAILSFDEVSGSLKLSGAFHLEWMDDFLKWNTSEYNLTTVRFPKALVWIPELIILNAKESFLLTMDDSENEESSLEFHNSGKVTYTPKGTIAVKCKPNMFRYPNDKHSCHVNVAPVESASKVSIFTASNGFRILDGFDNYQWDVLSMSSKNNTFYDIFTIVTFKLDLKRRPLFLILNLFLPTTLLNFLNVFVFLLPHASGERVSFAVTMLLSFAVFLNVISNDLPQISNPICVFNIYLGISLMSSTLITLFVIVSSKLHDKIGQEEQIQTGNETRACCVIPSSLGCKQNTVDKEHEIKSAATNMNIPERLQRNIWMKMAQTFDTCMFILLLAASIASTAISLHTIFDD